jgi:hypothetical protein
MDLWQKAISCVRRPHKASNHALCAGGPKDSVPADVVLRTYAPGRDVSTFHSWLSSAVAETAGTATHLGASSSGVRAGQPSLREALRSLAASAHVKGTTVDSTASKGGTVIRTYHTVNAVAERPTAMELGPFSTWVAEELPQLAATALTVVSCIRSRGGFAVHASRSPRWTNAVFQRSINWMWPR